MVNYGATYYYHIWEMPIFVVMAVVCGLLGVAFIWLNVKITSWRHRNIPVDTAWKRALEVVFVVFVTATLTSLLLYFSPCRPLPPDELLDYPSLGDQSNIPESERGNGKYLPRLYCKGDNEYSVFGQLFSVPLSKALRLLVHYGEAVPEDKPILEFDIEVVLLFFFLTYALMIWTYGIGAATGLFVPSLAVGAAFGRLAGRLVHEIIRAIGSQQRISLPSYAVVGAAASLGGATRMTISICVLVMETTGSLQLIVPIMVAVMVAKAVGDSFGLGIYDTHIEIRGTPMLEEPNFDYTQKMVHDKLEVQEMMSREMICLPPVVKLSDLAHVLRSTTHGAFPVSEDARIGEHTSGPFSLLGLVTRINVLRMLQRRVGILEPNDFIGGDPMNSDSNLLIPLSQRARLDLLQKLEQVPLKLRANVDQEPILNSLSAYDMDECYLDLRPFMQRHPFCIHSNAR